MTAQGTEETERDRGRHGFLSAAAGIVALLLLCGCASRSGVVTDGRAAEGAGSRPPALPLVAVLPFENISANPAPLKEMRVSLLERMRARGLNLLGEADLQSFMARHRIRYTGGVDQQECERFRKEAGVAAVLITTLELYMDHNPPKLVIVSHLASTETPSTVIWTDSAAMAGDDAPGILDLGVVESMKMLAPKAMDRLADSLASRMVDGMPPAAGRMGPNKFGPRGFFRASGIAEDRAYSIAVLPVVNHSTRKNAGEMFAGVLIEQLKNTGGFNVLEPGTLRDVLLRYRIVSPEGASLDTADLLFEQLPVDMILTGKVMDYDDTREPMGAPRVTFFLQIIGRQKKEVLWASHSTNKGNDGVFLFQAGRITTAHALASKMAEEVVLRLRGVDFSTAVPSFPDTGQGP